MHGSTIDTLGWSARGGYHPSPWSLWPGRDSRSRQRREETAATRPTARGCTGSGGREDAVGWCLRLSAHRWSPLEGGHAAGGQRQEERTDARSVYREAPARG